MTAEHRFCEACGAPLSPGTRFCEECGNPVPATPDTAPPESIVSSPPAPVDRPIAIIPFGYTQSGFLLVDNCTLVVYPDRVVVAYVPESMGGEMDRARRDIDAALLQTVEIASRPWKAYAAMPPDAVLAEDTRNRAVLRDAIAYVRGESDSDTSIEQILIRSADGLLTLYFELGTFSEAQKALLSFLAPASGSSESVLGVIPWGSEPQVKGFGFQYAWNLIVTNRRLVLCMCEDEFVDETVEWLSSREKEAKTAGRDRWDLDEMGRPDSPWQRLAGTPISGLLANDVNFFIPLRAVGAVEVVPGARRHGDEVRFTLPGEVVTLSFPQGTGELARGVLERALPGRVR